MAAYAGVDIGATNIRAVIGDESAHELGSDTRATPRGPNGIAVTEAILDSLRAACDNADVSPSSVVAAGIGSIGPLDLAEGVVENPANLPDTIDRIPLTGPVGNLIDSDRVFLHNDTNAGVIGELRFIELPAWRKCKDGVKKDWDALVLKEMKDAARVLKTGFFGILLLSWVPRR